MGRSPHAFAAPAALAAALAAALSACAAPRAGRPAAAPVEPSSPVPAAPAPSGTGTPPAPAVPPAEPTTSTEAQRARELQLLAPASAIVSASANATEAFPGALLADGRTVVFASDRDGAVQAHALEGAPGAEPRRITSGPGRVTWAAPSRDGRWLVFAREERPGETAVYRVALDGRGLTPLVPEPGIRVDPPVLPLRRPDLVVLARHRAGVPGTEVVLQPLSGEAGRVAWRSAGDAAVLDVSPDGARALVREGDPRGRAVLSELDLAAGTLRRLHPAEATGAPISAAAYTADGRWAYVATAGDAAAVTLVDPADGAVKERWEPGPEVAAVERVVSGPRGDVLAVALELAGRDEVRVLHPLTFAEVWRAPLPPGTVALGAFSKDGRTLVAAVSTPGAPPAPWAIDVAEGQVVPLVQEPKAAVARLGRVETLGDEVPAFDGARIRLVVHLPAGAPAGRRLPSVTWFSGGRDAARLRWDPTVRFLVARGYAVVEAGVRGTAGAGLAWERADDRERRGDVLRDVETVNAWLRKQPWADPARLVLAGEERGAWVVLSALASQPGYWRAGAALDPVADLSALVSRAEGPERAALSAEFGDPAQDAALLAGWSALRDVSRIAAPLFVAARAEDPAAPRRDADAVVNALRARGGVVEYALAGGATASDPRADAVERLARLARFLEEQAR
jgi:dipeptidyl aminopeptidase/acylaminoacyl peptidase